MSFGCDVIACSVGGVRLPCAVRGLQVGRFMVRQMFESEAHVGGESGQFLPRPWVVQHIPSGLCWSFDELQVALGVADALSLYSRVDPTSRSLDEALLRKQVGAQLYDWVEDIYSGRKPYSHYQSTKRAGYRP